jgi:hypothetical protein
VYLARAGKAEGRAWERELDRLEQSELIHRRGFIMLAGNADSLQYIAKQRTGDVGLATICYF